MSLPFDLVSDTNRVCAERLAQILKNPGFVDYFSDHMAHATWTKTEGWTDSRIENYHALQMPPGTAVFHYGQEIFEGMKVYRHSDGSIWLFRPEMNARRFNRSAIRMDLPELPEEDFLTSVHRLSRIDEAWVPSGQEMSYYLRPFMFANDEFLGVKSASRVSYLVIGGPAAPYLADGLTPVDIWVTTQYSRTGDAGTGAAKCGGNYAGALIAQREGADHGCSQVLFTDAATHTWIEELGGMNFCVVTRDNTLITPPTSGTILEGITRDSILTLAPDLGLTVDVRPLSAKELFSKALDGEIREAFACGTAAAVTPIGRLLYSENNQVKTVPLPQPLGEATRTLRNALVDIQWGRAEDTHGWLSEVRQSS
ncbi:MAG: branched-chain amino acid aminotransferase [Propionibacteriaceae bacterium]|jgi:branched-chain amino acid aminotransferase|nr:branched-chain amino acid aminotransferase [Propionibacteriaceae bacterium]